MIKLAGLKNSSLRLEPLALALAALVGLSACGGSGGAPEMNASAQPVQGIAVGEPNPSALVDKNVFIKMAQDVACGDRLNRLYIIDNSQVFWDVAGQCADASYSHALFGATPELKRCSSADSIAGPRTSCTDERYREIFDTIVKNREKADLGLGASHKIEVVDLTPQPKLGNTVPFLRLPVSAYGGSGEVDNVVVRDAKGWSVMWKRLHANVTDLPPEPWVDFSKDMVAVVMAGNGSSGCSNVGVVRVAEQDGAYHVEYAYAPPPEEGVMCTMAIKPLVDVVVVPKADNVKFEQIKTTPVKFKHLDARMSTTGTTAPFTAVVSDELQFNKLWNQYVDAATPAPSLDFSTQKVLFAWGGVGMTCQSTVISGVARAGGKLYASVMNASPGPATDCAAGVRGLGDVVVIERSDEPVVFANGKYQF